MKALIGLDGEAVLVGDVAEADGVLAGVFVVKPRTPKYSGSSPLLVT